MRSGTSNDLSCLDHLWHNLVELERQSFVLTPNLADHYAIASIFQIFVDSPPKVIHFRDFSDKNIGFYLSKIESEFLKFHPLYENLNEYAEYIYNFLKNIQNKFFPVHRKTISNKRIRLVESLHK